MSIFIKATKSTWYREFLKPVAATILHDPAVKKILDIGTGPGKLPELLHSQNPNLLITGIDIDTTMIDEARRNLAAENISWFYQKRDAMLEFAENEFDVVTLCSVLFLVDDQTKSWLLQESLRVLKPGGKVIVLTPTGLKSIVSAFPEARTYRPTAYNWTFPIWRMATSHRGRNWQKQNWLQGYSVRESLGYSSSIVFNNHAKIETVTKSFPTKNQKS
jgi:ubiquinone/menaquinone biosynthesis C-methylase UbiE